MCVCFSFQAVSRSGSTSIVSRGSQTSLLRHTLLDQHKRHSRGLSQESSPIIMKVAQIAKVSDGEVQVLTYVKFEVLMMILFSGCSAVLSGRYLPTFLSSALEMEFQLPLKC